MNAHIFTKYLLVLTVIFAIFVAPVVATDFAVNSAGDQPDVNPGDGICSVDGTPGLCSLRAAIQEANHWPGSDRITIPTGTWSLNLTGEDEDLAATGDLDIYDDLEIIGAGSTVVTIDGSQLGDRIFHMTNRNSMDPAPTIGIQGLTITGGTATTALTYLGGGIFNHSPDTIELTDVRVVANQANQGGGMDTIGGTITIDRCSFLDNAALDIGVTNVYGGGISNEAYQMEIKASTFSNNSAAGAGGNIFTQGCTQMKIISSTFVGATYNSMYAWNSNVEIIQSTVVTEDGIGISFGSYDGTNTLSLVGSILTGNPSQNCMITSGIYSHSANVESGDTCGFDTSSGELVDTDPELGPLSDNGGPTQTCEPKPGSPVIDLMDASDPNCQWEDQRGVRRPQDGNWDGVADCDVGAVESTLIFADGFESGYVQEWSGSSS